MDLTKQIDKNLSKMIIIINFYIVLVALTLYSCNFLNFFRECNDFELSMKDKCVEVDSVYSFSLGSLNDFEWDELYVIGGPRFPIEVEEIIDSEYKKVIPDDKSQYIFMRNGDIVKELRSSCRSFGFRGRHTEGVYFGKYTSSTIVSMKKEESEGIMRYRVVEVKIR